MEIVLIVPTRAEKHVRSALWPVLSLPLLLLICVEPLSAQLTSADSSTNHTLAARGAALDAHTHLMSQSLLDHLTGGGVPTAGADDLIAHLDAAKVERAVVLGLGYFDGLDDAAAAAENDFTASEVAKYPDRLIGFCGINPLLPGGSAEVTAAWSCPG